VSIYCERDQIAKVEAMFTPPAAQRPWVGLTQSEAIELLPSGGWGVKSTLEFAKAIEAKLREKNAL